MHATGLPAPNRSHFAAMEEVEDADPGSDRRAGWLNRLIGTDANASPLQGFNLGGGVPPTSLYGPQPVMSAGSVDAVRIPGDDEWDPDGRRVRSLHRLWDGDRTALGTRDAVDVPTPWPTSQPVRDTPDGRQRRGLPRARPRPRAAPRWPGSIRGNVGVEVITVDQGDWDMHSGLGTARVGPA